MTGAIQESLLCLLCFKSEGHLIRNLIPINLWDIYYRDIAEKAYAYWDEYKIQPGEHTLDLVDALCIDREKDREIFRRLYESMGQVVDEVNVDYVLAKARKYVRQQKLKAAITRAVDQLQQGDLDAVEQTLMDSMKSVIDLFEPGRWLEPNAAILDFLSLETQSFSTGVPQLDTRSLGPVRGELHLFIAPPKRGKTWWLVNLGKQGILQRQRVLHVSLEMGEARMTQRYLQALFSVSKRPGKFVGVNFDEDELGRFVGMVDKEIPTRPSFMDSDINKVLMQALGRLERRPKLLIKQFPTGDLTVRELEGYLDMLEVTAKYIPDLLLLDYADLMSVSVENYRHDLGKLYKDLRGLAVRRNIAVATASQANREGTRATVVQDIHVAEDMSKIATADTVITYNQTPTEKELGVARLFVADSRNDEDRFTVLISQNYNIGQFCLDSTRMMSSYWEAVHEEKGDK